MACQDGRVESPAEVANTHKRECRAGNSIGGTPCPQHKSTIREMAALFENSFATRQCGAVQTLIIHVVHHSQHGHGCMLAGPVCTAVAAEVWMTCLGLHQLPMMICLGLHQPPIMKSRGVIALYMCATAGAILSTPSAPSVRCPVP